MRDFGLRAINRGETQKKMSRRQQAKLAAGVTPTASKSVGDSNSIAAAVDDIESSDEDSRKKSKRKAKSSRVASEAGNGLDSDEELSNFTNTAQQSAALKKARGGANAPSDIRTAIEALVDRRKAGAYKGTRENLLAIIGYQARHFDVTEELEESLEELLPAILRSAKLTQSGSQSEAQLALEVLSTIAITINSKSLYEETQKSLRRIITLNSDPETKAGAIQTYGMVAHFGGARQATLLETTMPFLIEIVSSDGSSINADDNGLVVTAAQQQWGLIASRVELSAAAVREPMEAFVDQLDSADADVLVSAGENIALVYEQSYARRFDQFESLVGSDDESGAEEDHGESRNHNASHEEDVERCRARFKSVFNPYTQHSHLVDKLTDLSKISGKRISADTRRRLHASFSDILNSVSRHPGLGPGYQTALGKETGQAGGNRIVVQMSSTTAGEEYRGHGTVPINRWWQLIRLQALRRALAAGVAVQWMAGNEAVVRALSSPPPRSRSGYVTESRYGTDEEEDDYENED